MAQPLCPLFGTCGGCQAQDRDLDAYRAWKIDRVKAALTQGRGLDLSGCEVGWEPAHGLGRRRMTLHIEGNTPNVCVGFMEAKSHRLVGLNTCPVACPSLRDAPRLVRELVTFALKPRPRFHAHVVAADQGIVCTFQTQEQGRKTHRQGALDPNEAEKLGQMGERLGFCALFWNTDPIAHWRHPTVTFGSIPVSLPPHSFLQATALGEERLWSFCKEALSEATAPIDLFCGLGPFALRLAQTVPVRAYDGDKEAVGALSRAAKRPGLKPITAITRDLFRLPLGQAELRGCDGVVIDPPRQGARAQMHELAQSRIPKIVALSCDPKTFARDGAVLCAGGYTLEKITVIDQFQWTPHAEIAALFVAR